MYQVRSEDQKVFAQKTLSGSWEGVKQLKLIRAFLFPTEEPTGKPEEGGVEANVSFVQVPAAAAAAPPPQVVPCRKWSSPTVSSGVELCGDAFDELPNHRPAVIKSMARGRSWKSLRFSHYGKRRGTQRYRSIHSLLFSMECKVLFC